MADQWFKVDSDGDLAPTLLVSYIPAGDSSVVEAEFTAISEDTTYTDGDQNFTTVTFLLGGRLSSLVADVRAFARWDIGFEFAGADILSATIKYNYTEKVGDDFALYIYPLRYADTDFSLNPYDRAATYISPVSWNTAEFPSATPSIIETPDVGDLLQHVIDADGSDPGFPAFGGTDINTYAGFVIVPVPLEPEELQPVTGKIPAYERQPGINVDKVALPDYDVDLDPQILRVGTRLKQKNLIRWLNSPVGATWYVKTISGNKFTVGPVRPKHGSMDREFTLEQILTNFIRIGGDEIATT